MSSEFGVDDAFADISDELLESLEKQQSARNACSPFPNISPTILAIDSAPNHQHNDSQYSDGGLILSSLPPLTPSMPNLLLLSRHQRPTPEGPSQAEPTSAIGPLRWTKKGLRLAPTSNTIQERMLQALTDAKDNYEFAELLKDLTEDEIQQGVDLIVAGIIQARNYTFPREKKTLDGYQLKPD
ncbi:hypothetical protein QFC21_006404 [Naganishia friedmannii]|uniref:Uncharacterized protein n=1 Tax=Naganishia friedmannii TaxID=89922 RepID=A0ACC2V2Z3_9TREE|nr:hypothetical protein QFC21_006404 [Naganishia friedmannii]